MIGVGLKKLAKEYGLTVEKGVAYGELKGFFVTFKEGSGYKQMMVATHLDEDIINELIEVAKATNCDKNYRVNNLMFTPMMTQVIFVDNPGTMPLIQKFIEWFFPMLEAHGATKADCCPYCGEKILEAAKPKLVHGAVVHMHDSCARRYSDELEQEYKGRTEMEGTSYFKGFIGALLGAIIGVIIWALILNSGYIAAFAALAIAWLADFGYVLFKGKKGRGKIAILVSVTVLAIIVGTFAGDAIEMVKLIRAGEVDATYADIPSWFVGLFATNPEYVKAFVQNLLMGLAFGGVGCFYFLRRKGVDAGKVQMKDF